MLLDEKITEEDLPYTEEENRQGKQKQLALRDIYHIGYRSPSALEMIDQALEENPSLMIVDIRYTPTSRNPAWTQDTLQERYQNHYTWLRDLGNINHHADRPIQLADPNSGITQFMHLLQQHSLIILCGCPEYETCHRKHVIELYEQKQLAFDPEKKFWPTIRNLQDVIKPVTPPADCK
ncbi:MAG: DUF488 domain-containing protein, partial [Ktedonobacteraceae bacterium]